LVNWKHVQGQICTSLLATVMLLAPSKLIFQPKLRVLTFSQIIFIITDFWKNYCTNRLRGSQVTS